MRLKYQIAVFGCLVHAAAFVGVQTPTVRAIHDHLGSLAVTVLWWSLLVSWPMWAFVLWRYSETYKIRRTVIPIFAGLLIMSPLIIFYAALVFGAQQFRQ